MTDAISTDVLFHTTIGHGIPVVVLHAGLGLDHTYILPALEPLAADARLTLVDLRGNGRSPLGLPWSEVTRERWAEDLEGVRRALGCEQFVLFGHSYGGIIAQEYALRHADRLCGLVLCCTVPAFDYPDVIAANIAARADAHQQQLLAEALGGGLHDDARYAEIWRAILPMYFHRYRPEYTRAFDRVIFSAAAYNHSFFAVAPTVAPLDALATVSVPTLILAGGDDWISPVEQGAARLVAALPRSELRVFEDSGHFPFLEEPAAFLAVLSDWLKRRARSV